MVWLIATLFLSICATAGNSARLKDLDIQVVIQDNGDARITEVRKMNVTMEGTECYIVVDNLHGSRIQDLEVTDEHGDEFENIGRWDTSMTRIEKTRKCGLVSKTDGYEVCWGLGEDGEREYTVSYTVTSLLRGYRDSDGFNYMFVAHAIKPSAEHVRVTISREGGDLEAGTTKMWAFRYHGDVQLRNGNVVAETDTEMTEENAMIVMLEINKGIFHPTKEMDTPFVEVKKEAFEGSDYLDAEDSEHSAFYSDGYKKPLKERLKDIGLWILTALLLLAMPIFLIINTVMVAKSKRKCTKDLGWYRDIPYMGNLQRANSILNAHNFKTNDYKNLISASVLRLLSLGVLRIEDHYIEPNAIGRMFGRQGETRACIVIGEWKNDQNLVPYRVLTLLYQIFIDAAGSDRILQPNELKKWMRCNRARVEQLIQKASESMPLKELNRQHLEQARQVYGLRKFLKDFTLASERHVNELPLWREYLVWAELFGISKQVRRDMMSINPEYLQFDQVTRTMMDNNIVPVFTAAALSGVREVQAARSGGRGGSASGGGGGGFSGGGSGGGIR